MPAPGIITPDAVGLDLEVATAGSRGAAYLLDALILVSVLLLLGLGQSVLGTSGFVPGWFGIALLLLLAFAWQFGYPIAFEVLAHGRTPGKAAMGLRVVTVEGAPVGVRHAVIRATVGILELLGTLGAVAILTSFASRRGQRLGDLAAGTLVVRERRGRGSPEAQAFTAPAGREVYVERMDTSGLVAADYAAVRETLLRAGQLPSAVRSQVTADLAGRLVDRVRPAPPADCSAEEFLRCVAVAVQARRSRQGTRHPGLDLDAAPSHTVPRGGGRPLAAPDTARAVSDGTDRPDPPVPTPGGFVPPD